MSEDPSRTERLVRVHRGSSDSDSMAYNGLLPLAWNVVRKGGQTMIPYGKPEVTEVGDAALIIQGSKPVFGENGDITRPNGSSEEIE